MIFGHEAAMGFLYLLAGFPTLNPSENEKRERKNLLVDEVLNMLTASSTHMCLLLHVFVRCLELAWKWFVTVSACCLCCNSVATCLELLGNCLENVWQLFGNCFGTCSELF